MVGFIVMVLLWYRMMSIFNKKNLYFYKFLIGALGLFSLLLLYGNDIIEFALLETISNILERIDIYFEAFSVFSEARMINVKHHGKVISFFIDYECTGIIENLVFFSLVVFYPVYSNVMKLVQLLKGYIYITVVNTLRILLILYIIHFGGTQFFFIAHAIIGRLFFFIMIIILYFNTFTKKHILIQPVGDQK